MSTSPFAAAISHRWARLLVVESASCRSCPVRVAVSLLLRERAALCVQDLRKAKTRTRSEGTQTRDKRAHTRTYGTRMGTDKTHDAMECFVSPVVVAGNLHPWAWCLSQPHNARAQRAVCLVSSTRLCVAQHSRVLHALARLSPSRKRGSVAVVPRQRSLLDALGRVCPWARC
jgi:hypothetical protein